MTPETISAAPRGRSKSSLLLTVLLLAAAALFPSILRAQSPLDGFDPGYGASEPVHTVAVQPDGKVLIGDVLEPVGRQTLYLLPDRILVFQGSAVGAVGYDQLELRTKTTQFIESGEESLAGCRLPGTMPGSAPLHAGGEL